MFFKIQGSESLDNNCHKTFTRNLLKLTRFYTKNNIYISMMNMMKMVGFFMTLLLGGVTGLSVKGRDVTVSVQFINFTPKSLQ